MIESISEFFSNVSADAWVNSVGTLLGAFAGALIAGMISMKAARKQINYDQKKEIRNEYSNFMKFQEEYQKIITPALGNIELMEKHFEENNYDKAAELAAINGGIINRTKNIDTSHLSHAALEKVNSLNSVMTNVTFVALLMQHGGNDLTKEANLKAFYKDAKELRDLVKDLNKYKRSLERVID